MVWIYGEFGGQIDSAPYLLEDMIDDIRENSGKEDTIKLKLQVIYLVIDLAIKLLC